MPTIVIYSTIQPVVIYGTFCRFLVVIYGTFPGRVVIGSTIPSVVIGGTFQYLEVLLFTTQLGSGVVIDSTVVVGCYPGHNW